jgi:hypothetical protein
MEHDGEPLNHRDSSDIHYSYCVRFLLEIQNLTDEEMAWVGDRASVLTAFVPGPCSSGEWVVVAMQRDPRYRNPRWVKTP